jgi:hypothetical protein
MQTRREDYNSIQQFTLQGRLFDSSQQIIRWHET